MYGTAFYLKNVKIIPRSDTDGGRERWRSEYEVTVTVTSELHAQAEKKGQTMIYAKYDLAYGDDVYDYMGARLQLEGETENMGV